MARAMKGFKNKAGRIYHTPEFVGSDPVGRNKPELFEDLIRGLAWACLSIMVVCIVVMAVRYGWDGLINMWRLVG